MADQSNNIPPVLGLVLARAGSVRTPNKNGRTFAGHSLIEISMEQVLRAKNLCYVGLSTDSEIYLSLARRMGLEEDYLRPDELAGPKARSIDCTLHYVDWLAREKGQKIENIMLLQPTSPFRTANQIDDAVEQWVLSGCRSLVSVTPARHDQDCVIARHDGRLYQPYLETGVEFFVLDGAIFLTSVSQLRETCRFWDEGSTLFVNQYPCIYDIDTEDDFATAAAAYGAITAQ